MEYTRLKTELFVGTGETNSQDWIWVVAKQVTDIPFGLYYYWIHSNTALPDITKYDTQC